MKLSQKYHKSGVAYLWHAAVLIALAALAGSFVVSAWAFAPVAGGFLAVIAIILLLSGLFRILDAFEWFQRANDERALDARYSTRPRHDHPIR